MSKKLRLGGHAAIGAEMEIQLRHFSTSGWSEIHPRP